MSDIKSGEESPCRRCPYKHMLPKCRYGCRALHQYQTNHIGDNTTVLDFNGKYILGAEGRAGLR